MHKKDAQEGCTRMHKKGCIIRDTQKDAQFKKECIRDMHEDGIRLYKFA